jgi:hypothetical protein
LRFEKSSTILEDILNVQRSPFDRTGLGYNNNKKNNDREIPKISEKSQSYENVLRSSNHSGNTIKNDANNTQKKEDQ